MNQEYNLKNSYKNVVDKNFVLLCQSVIQSMTANANFPDVGNHLTDLITLNNDYLSAIPSPQSRNQLNVANKDNKRELVKTKLRTLGFYAQLIAQDDLEKLKSSGFPIARLTGSASKELPMPIILGMTTTGIAKQLIVRCQAATAARLYDVRVSTDQVNWLYKNSDGKTRVTLDDLPVDTVLYVQSRLRNSDHITPWSASVITRIFDSAIALPTAD
jgi:hypothetical protein